MSGAEEICLNGGCLIQTRAMWSSHRLFRISFFSALRFVCGERTDSWPRRVLIINHHVVNLKTKRKNNERRDFVNIYNFFFFGCPFCFRESIRPLRCARATEEEGTNNKKTTDNTHTNWVFVFCDEIDGNSLEHTQSIVWTARHSSHTNPMFYMSISMWKNDEHSKWSWELTKGKKKMKILCGNDKKSKKRLFVLVWRTERESKSQTEAGKNDRKL